MIPTNRPSRGGSRGTGLVAGMVALGCLSTAGLFWFWQTRTADFLPLADALAAELPGSSPRVEGGRRRRPDPDVTLLQVMLKVPLRPRGDGRQSPRRTPPRSSTGWKKPSRPARSPGGTTGWRSIFARTRPAGVMRSATFTRPAP